MPKRVKNEYGLVVTTPDAPVGGAGSPAPNTQPSAAPAAAQAAGQKGETSILGAVVPAVKQAISDRMQVDIGGAKGAMSTVAGLGELMRRPGLTGGVGEGLNFLLKGNTRDSDAPAFEQFRNEFADPKGIAQKLGFGGEQAAEFMVAPEEAGPRVGGKLAMIMKGAARKGIQSGAVRAAQTGGDPGETATAAALGFALPAAGGAIKEGVLRPAAKAATPFLMNKVIGATPKMFKNTTGPRDVAMSLLEEGPVNSRRQLLDRAVVKMKDVQTAIEEARNKGAVAGHGVVPKALLELEGHTKMLIDGMGTAIQKSKASMFPGFGKIATRGGGLGLMSMFEPTLAGGTAAVGAAKVAAEQPAIASRLARFGAGMGKAPKIGLPPVAARTIKGKAAAVSANVLHEEAEPLVGALEDRLATGQSQMSLEEVEGLNNWWKEYTGKPGFQGHSAVRGTQVDDILSKEGLSGEVADKVRKVYGRGQLSLSEAIDSVLGRSH